MSTITVITFDDEQQAGHVRESLHKLQNSGGISLDDSAVIVKDQNGKIHIKNEMDRGTAVGAVGGGLLGLMITSIFFPIAGLVVGAIGGALVGKSLGGHVDKEFVKDVTESMQPGSSAIFIIARSGNPDAVIAVLEPYNGKIFHTSLPTEAEESLRQALK